MKTTSFATTINVKKPVQEVYDAINTPREWWSQNIEGSTDQQGAVFFHYFEDVHYCKLKIEELIPDKRVVWLVLDNYFSFIKDQSEWKDTRIIFDISQNGDQTEIKFTHEGLVPAYECYDLCESEWNKYMTKSLYDLITIGKGKPNTKDDKKFDAAFEQWKSNN